MSPAPDSGHIPDSDVRERLAVGRVVLLGCGGLGSNIAAMLLRSGVRDLVLVDSDAVEADNLNRQLFFADQIGRPKVEALAETLGRIDSSARIELCHERIDAGNLVRLVQGADVIVEAVDDAGTKALIVDVCTQTFPGTPIVAASGVAGYGEANLVRTEQVAECLWVCGDFASDIREGSSLLASRVTIAAAHQAHAVIRLLLGMSPT